MISFEEKEDRLEVIDSIERRRDTLLTAGQPELEYIDTSEIVYPVDELVETEIDGITLPVKSAVYILDENGSMRTDIHPEDTTSLPKREYILDISNSMKVYAHVRSSISVYSDNKQTHIDFGGSTRAVIGVRSFHTRPEETVTTTSDPTDVMQAVSVFGSALKTTKPERSYPTLRGHPPTIELGDELDIPEGIKRPDTDVHIEIPPSLSHIFIASPLAYYLGARLTSSPNPKITTTTGYSFNLDQKGGYQTMVNQILKQIVFLDCIVRTEGISPGPLQERELIEPILNFDVETVYNQTLAERLETYLEIPFSTVQQYLPEWGFESRLKPTVESIQFLPFIANKLTSVSVENEKIRQRNQDNDRFYDSILHSNDHPVIKQCWPSNDQSQVIGATPLSAYYNALNQTPRNGPIKIDIICNDPAMTEELVAVYGAYGNREELPFEVAIYHELQVDELKGVLRQSSDFIHYIGHMDSNGFRCSDGNLSPESLKTVQAKSFLLNACQSLDQGLSLVESGSLGGIVTLKDIDNRDAVRAGNLIARLLNQGFPLYGAIDILRHRYAFGDEYQIVGKGTSTVAQPDHIPMKCSITKKEGRNKIDLGLSTKSDRKVGSVYNPYISSIDRYQLLPNKTECISITKGQLMGFLDTVGFPIFIDDCLHMSSDVSLQDL